MALSSILKLLSPATQQRHHLPTHAVKIDDDDDDDEGQQKVARRRSLNQTMSFRYRPSLLKSSWSLINFTVGAVKLAENYS